MIQNPAFRAAASYNKLVKWGQIQLAIFSPLNILAN